MGRVSCSSLVDMVGLVGSIIPVQVSASGGAVLGAQLSHRAQSPLFGRIACEPELSIFLLWGCM